MIVSGLNHLAHDIMDDGIDPPAKKTKTTYKISKEQLDQIGKPTKIGLELLEYVEGGGVLKGGEKIYEVYQLVNKETKVVEYIGKTSQGLMKRFEQHLLDPKKQSWINNTEIQLVNGGLTKFGAKYYEQSPLALVCDECQLTGKIKNKAFATRVIQV